MRMPMKKARHVPLPLGEGHGEGEKAGQHLLVKEGKMRQGFRVIDSDTHVNPSLDVLLRYADKYLRERIDDLRPFMLTVELRPGQGAAEDRDADAIVSI